MELIKNILSRQKNYCFERKLDKIKASISHIKKTEEALRKSVKEIRELVKDMVPVEKALRDLGTVKTSESKSFKSKINKRYKELEKALKRLDKAAAMYYKIDDTRNDYTDEEKKYLGELQKYWHSIKLDFLPSENISMITDIVIKNNLQNARYLLAC